VEAKLVVVDGETKARQYDLQLPTVIGRSRSTDLMVGHPLVSRQHCEVFEANGMLMVRDLGSLNGTFVGEMRITEQAIPVKPGDLLTIGPVTFKAVYRADGDQRGQAIPWDPEGPTIDAPLTSHRHKLKDTRGRHRYGNGHPNDDTSPPQN